jgi:hypothetical protein
LNNTSPDLTFLFLFDNHQTKQKQKKNTTTRTKIIQPTKQMGIPLCDVTNKGRGWIGKRGKSWRHVRMDSVPTRKNKRDYLSNKKNKTKVDFRLKIQSMTLINSV